MLRLAASLGRRAAVVTRLVEGGFEHRHHAFVVLRRFALWVLAGAAHWRREAMGGNEATGGRWPGGR